MNERRAINDPPEVFEEEAKLLAQYAGEIDKDAAHILGELADNRDAVKLAAQGYIATIGNNIPDQTIKAAVKRLATVRFQRRGM